MTDIEQASLPSLPVSYYAYGELIIPVVFAIRTGEATGDFLELICRQLPIFPGSQHFLDRLLKLFKGEIKAGSFAQVKPGVIVGGIPKLSIKFLLGMQFLQKIFGRLQ
jgi:hypothetical protein